jgi:GT2 family glycosyltransferase
MDDQTAPAKLKPPGPSTPRLPSAGARQAAAFDEDTYLRFNPDVRLAVANGAFASGREHFERYGRAEGRPFARLGPKDRNRVIPTADTSAQRETAKPPGCAVESIRLSATGGIFVVGWINDALDPLDSLDLYFSTWSVAFDSTTIARARRQDAEHALGPAGRHLYGFWGFLYADRPLAGGQCSAVLRLRSGAEIAFVIIAEMVTDHDLRKSTLGYLAAAMFYGNQPFEAVASIENGIGAHLVSLNKSISREVVSGTYVERFGTGRARYRGSLIVCLYGRAEHLFLQNAMFAQQTGMADYEIIYVSNSPQIAEALLREAKLCALTYGIDQTVIILGANGGVAAANNLAATHARSDRLMFINPDVFPRSDDWITRHSALVADLPPDQTSLFGAPLYYDDGSLMHAGMYFDLETVPSFAAPGRTANSLLSVEHIGRGAPPAAASYLRPRPVPAITGAFMSIHRPWFEKLAGFTDDYIFSHFEDADFCLKSIRAGRLPWLHNNKLWHLEGTGSTRLRQHDGGYLVNRWLFTKTWRAVVEPDLLGPNPARKAFGGPGSARLPAKRAAP